MDEVESKKFRGAYTTGDIRAVDNSTEWKLRVLR